MSEGAKLADGGQGKRVGKLPCVCSRPSVFLIDQHDIGRHACTLDDRRLAHFLFSESISTRLQPVQSIACLIFYYLLFRTRRTSTAVHEFFYHAARLFV